MIPGLRLRAAGFGLVLMLGASPAVAQQPSVRGEAIVGYQHFLASETFKAIFGTANAPVYGGGVDIGLWRHRRRRTRPLMAEIFVRVDATRFSKTGQRAFVANGIAYPLGIPLTVTITPVTVTGGYQADLTKSIALYAGGGAGSWSYTEKTDDPSETVSFRKAGFVVLGGAEWRLQKYVAVGFEGQYASVANAIGASGISQQYNEKDIGGASFAARLILGR